MKQSIFDYDLLLARSLSNSNQPADLAIRDFVVELSKTEGKINAFLSAAGVVGGVGVCASGAGTMACAAGALGALASGNHLYGDAQQAITGNEARTALVQALTAQGLNPADAAKYQAYVDAGAVVVTLGIVGGQAVYRFTVNSTRVSAADRAALASLEQKGGVADGVPGGPGSGGGFYDAHAWRKNYEDFYNGNVTSTTVPPYSAKNVHMAGQRHPVTGIVYDQRGYPVFDDIASYDTRLSSSQFSGVDYQGQMRMATRELRSMLEANPHLQSRFEADQLQAIQSGSASIPRLTWHHHQDPGRMQLVPRDIHRDTGHVGGNAASRGL